MRAETLDQSQFSIEHLREKTHFFSEYYELRMQLWPQPENECQQEAFKILANQERWSVFLARLENLPVGFLEVSLRDYAEGASISPVAYIEGWFVVPGQRRLGIGKLLIGAAESWALSRGCTEIASDTQLDNAVSIAAHQRLGYQEIERQVCFLKQIKTSDQNSQLTSAKRPVASL